jgi:hypothetical protein
MNRSTIIPVRIAKYRSGAKVKDAMNLVMGYAGVALKDFHIKGREQGREAALQTRKMEPQMIDTIKEAAPTTTATKRLFPLGQTYATPGAMEA